MPSAADGLEKDEEGRSLEKDAIEFSTTRIADASLLKTKFARTKYDSTWFQKVSFINKPSRTSIGGSATLTQLAEAALPEDGTNKLSRQAKS